MSVTGFPPLTAGENGDSPRHVESPRSGLDRAFRVVLMSCAGVVVLLVFAITLFLAQKAWPVLQTRRLWFLHDFGLGARDRAEYGILGDLLGTVVVAVVALAVAFPISLATALAINEYVPGAARRVLITLIDLLAAVPSLVYGLWGVTVFDTWVTGPTTWLSKYAAFFPLFQPGPGQGRPLAVRMRAGGGDHGDPHRHLGQPRGHVAGAPASNAKGRSALGGTKWGMVTDVILPFARNGIIGAALLGLGRALGETIAVTLILSVTNLPTSHILYPGGGTVPALIVDWYAQVGSGRGLDALTLAGLTLFALTLGVNIVARIIVSRSGRMA